MYVLLRVLLISLTKTLLHVFLSYGGVPIVQVSSCLQGQAKIKPVVDIAGKPQLVQLCLRLNPHLHTSFSTWRFPPSFPWDHLVCWGELGLENQDGTDSCSSPFSRDLLRSICRGRDKELVRSPSSENLKHGGSHAMTYLTS